VVAGAVVGTVVSGNVVSGNVVTAVVSTVVVLDDSLLHAPISASEAMNAMATRVRSMTDSFLRTATTSLGACACRFMVTFTSHSAPDRHRRKGQKDRAEKLR
jgi:hypothetical protein